MNFAIALLPSLVHLLKGAGLEHILEPKKGGQIRRSANAVGGKMSPQSGFVRRMMAENAMKHKGQYRDPTKPLHPGSTMAAPIPFVYEALANDKQRGQNESDYGASPFIQKHFGTNKVVKLQRKRGPVPEYMRTQTPFPNRKRVYARREHFAERESVASSSSSDSSDSSDSEEEAPEAPPARRPLEISYGPSMDGKRPKEKIERGTIEIPNVLSDVLKVLQESEAKRTPDYLEGHVSKAKLKPYIDLFRKVRERRTKELINTDGTTWESPTDDTASFNAGFGKKDLLEPFIPTNSVELKNEPTPIASITVRGGKKAELHTVEFPNMKFPYGSPEKFIYDTKVRGMASRQPVMSCVVVYRDPEEDKDEVETLYLKESLARYRKAEIGNWAMLLYEPVEYGVEADQFEIENKRRDEIAELISAYLDTEDSDSSLVLTIRGQKWVRDLAAGLHVKRGLPKGTYQSRRSKEAQEELNGLREDIAALKRQKDPNKKHIKELEAEAERLYWATSPKPTSRDPALQKYNTEARNTVQYNEEPTLTVKEKAAPKKWVRPGFPPGDFQPFIRKIKAEAPKPPTKAEYKGLAAYWRDPFGNQRDVAKEYGASQSAISRAITKFDKWLPSKKDLLPKK